MATINVQFEFTEDDARKVVAEEVQRRLKQRFPDRYGLDVNELIDQRIRQAIRDEVQALDLGAQVREVIQATLGRVLEDTARRQIKDIVRLATRQELAAARAESEGGVSR